MYQTISSVVSVFHHHKNKGLSGTKNTGFWHSTGDYLHFLDSDDEITPTCIESLMRAAREDPSSEIVQGYSSCPLVDSVLPDRERLAKQLLPLSFKSNEDISMLLQENGNNTYKCMG